MEHVAGFRLLVLTDGDSYRLARWIVMLLATAPVLSDEREPPPGEPVASSQGSRVVLVAAIVTIPGTRPGH